MFKNIYGTPTIYNCSLMLIQVTGTIYLRVLAKAILHI